MSIGENLKKGKNSKGFEGLASLFLLLVLVILLGYGIERLVSSRQVNTPVKLQNGALLGI